MTENFRATSSLLFNEEPLTINRRLAKVIGLNESIVVQQIHYWLNINRKAKINFHNGRVWTYNTYEVWHEENFDIWSLRTVNRIFSSLFKKNILLKGNYNKNAYDKTLWVSINYDKLEELLSNYNEYKKQEDVGIPTLCQDDTMSDSNIMPLCHNGLCQSGIIEDDKVALPIPETTRDLSETSFTTQLKEKAPVVNTNKEIIETKTHLLLDSKNKIDKVKEWKKDRLEKAIDIFINQEGKYFTLLEKIYKDDKNFVPPDTNNKFKYKTNRAHNVNNTFDKYSEEDLERLLLESQKGKFN